MVSSEFTVHIFRQKLDFSQIVSSEFLILSFAVLDQNWIIPNSKQIVSSEVIVHSLQLVNSFRPKLEFSEMEFAVCSFFPTKCHISLQFHITIVFLP